MSTVGLTEAVSVRGIGNRPGADSDEQRLPLAVRAARRRAAGLGASPRRGARAPAVPARDLPEPPARDTRRAPARTRRPTTTSASRSAAHAARRASTRSPARACSTATRGASYRADVAAGYAEPFEMAGKDGMRPLTLTSLYPPRRDAIPVRADDDPICRAGGTRSCNDHPDVATYDADARAAMPDIDAVTMATPPADAADAAHVPIPDSWPRRRVRRLHRGQHRGRLQRHLQRHSPTRPPGGRRGTAGQDTGYPYRGQPSVVYACSSRSARCRRTYPVERPRRLWLRRRERSDAGELHMMDGTITNDPPARPAAAPIAAGRRAPKRSGSPSRCETAGSTSPGCRAASRPRFAADTKHSHEWGELSFEVGDSLMAVTKYGSAPRPSPSRSGLVPPRGTRPSRPTPRRTGLVVPTEARGTKVNVTFGGLQPRTHYWVAVRAVDVCNVVSAYAVAELSTTKTNFTQLSGCFVATAAYGSALQPQVAALRGSAIACWAPNPISRRARSSTTVRVQPRPRCCGRAIRPGADPDPARAARHAGPAGLGAARLAIPGTDRPVGSVRIYSRR